MTPQQRAIAYASSRAAAKKEISRAEAIDRIAKSGVAAGSANIVVEVFLALSKGEVFKRALSEPDTVANAVAACPNCHREEHYGKRR
jgi:cytochrome c553